MTTLFYLIAYAAILGFCVIAFCKVRSYLAASPLHVRWELYPIGHEGAKAAYGGSFMEEGDWWTKPRAHNTWGDIRDLMIEVLFLHATFKHNLKLWFRTYPFHVGLYMLMGGTFLTLITAIAKLSGGENHGFIIFLGNVINAVSMLGMLGIIGGGIGLIYRRISDEGLNKYTTAEHYLNLVAFIVYAFFGLAAWAINPSFYVLSRDFLANLISFNFAPLGSSAFALHVFLGFLLMIWIPATHMGHLIMKYFTYHDIRWGDEPTCASEKNQKKISEALTYPVSWSAPHIEGDGKKTWVDVATTNPAAPKND